MHNIYIEGAALHINFLLKIWKATPFLYLNLEPQKSRYFIVQDIIFRDLFFQEI